VSSTCDFSRIHAEDRENCHEPGGWNV